MLGPLFVGDGLPEMSSSQTQTSSSSGCMVSITADPTGHDPGQMVLDDPA